jgi:mono/diheme cytochrome c family protein
MKKTKAVFAFLLIAIISVVFAGCGSDSGPSSPGALTVTTATLAGGTVGTAYSQTVAASGGTGSYTWSISAGALPAGLNLNTSSGLISGTPTTAGAATNFTVMVTDSATPTANTATKALSITVTAPGALVVTTLSLPGATVGTAYSQTLAATGGTGSYTWSISVGALPAGLNLNTSTGLISGTPTTTGAATNFTVTVTDSATPTANTATKPLSITVASNTPAVPAAPTGVVATGGTNSVTVTWPAVTGATTYNVYWLATTGVTTAGTKIPLGNVLSVKHSRLTTTPTWLAANTPYFYIVTAVNANGESAPSSQATATTSATDGVALYATDCAGCHGALSSANRQHIGATTTLINAGIANNFGGMGTRFSATGSTPLNQTQVSAIADVMAAGF